MDDLISRRAAIDTTWEDPSYTDPLNVLSEVRDKIKALSSAQPEQRKRGKWIPQNMNQSNGMISTAVYYYPKCSVCGGTANFTNFCPNCGADMRGEQDDSI